jgi:hypothetical protein
MADEYRTLRTRMAALRAARQRTSAESPDPPARMVGRVFEESTLPTTVPKYFAVHPVDVGGAEGEGDAPTLAERADETLYVAVLGPQVPVAGDDLIATSISGRWVANHGGSDKQPCPGNSGTGCPLPPKAKQLLAHVVEVSSGIPWGTYTLTWTETDAYIKSVNAPTSDGGWMSDCIANPTFSASCPSFVRIRFFCTANQGPAWNAQGYAGTYDPPCVSITDPSLLTCGAAGTVQSGNLATWAPATLISNTCEPFYYHYRFLSTAGQGLTDVFFSEAP